MSSQQQSTATWSRALGAAAAGFLLATTLFTGLAEAAATSHPSGWIDTPGENVQLSGTSAAVAGWALDAGATTGTGVDRVDVYLDNSLRGAAVYGDTRTDMAAAFGANFVQAGFHATLDLTRVGGGTHTLEIRAHSTLSNAWTSYTRTVTVVRPLRFGVNAHLMWYGLDWATQDLDRIKAAGLTSVRLDFYWSTVEPTVKGAFDHAYLVKLDGVVAAARARGIRTTIVVMGTPAWARGNTGTIMTPPTRPADFADDLDMLARRYASVPGMAYELWNEPNQTQFWNAPGGPDPAAYTRLLQSTYPRIKAAAPSAIVLGGSIAFNDQAFIKGVYAAGGKNFFDILALHPYSIAYGPASTASAYESYILALQQMDATMGTFGDANKPIWITESGWSLHDVSESARAGYMQQAAAMLVNLPYVEEYQAYALNQAEDMPDMGLTFGDGRATSSWTAFVGAAKKAATDRTG